jgi:hypothetical protein
MRRLLSHLVKRGGPFLAVAAFLMLVAPTASATRTVDRVVYTRGCDSGPQNPVWIVEPTAGSEPVPSVSKDSLGVRVSPDGEQLLLSMFGGLSTANADGTGAVLVADVAIVGRYPEYPTWSPDGDKVALVAHVDGERRIMILDLDSNQAPIVVKTIGEKHPSGLDWSPGGQVLVWSWRAPVSETGIEVITVSDGTSEPLGEGSNPRYSPDGTTIAFSRAGFLATMTSDGSDLWISEQPGRSPTWSPDGTRLAFVDRKPADDHVANYIGVYEIGTGRVTVLVEGTIDCDDVLDLGDWAFLQWPRFLDVAFDHLFVDDVEWLAAERITKGCDPPVNDHFCPSAAVTRGQMAAFLVRALGLTDRLDDPFVDDDGSVFEADIERLAAAGITKGCNPPDNDRFCPDSKVTREQMAAFLVRAFGYADDGGGDLFIDDNDSIFEHDIDRLASAGITKGCNPPDNTQYCPTAYVSRGQMAAFIHRALR